MAGQFITVEENTLSGGIDARSSENLVQPGYVADLLNGEVIEQRVRQRAGYQGYAGNIPVRVVSLEYKDTENQICLTLDESVDLLNTIPSPITIFGRSSSIPSGGPFTSSGDATKWYSTFTVELRKPMPSGSGSISIPNTEHFLGTSNALISVVESTSTFNTSYQSADLDSISIDSSTYAVTSTYDNNTTDKQAIAFYLSREDDTGFSKNISLGTISSSSSSHAFSTITAATHGLSNYNIIPQLFQDSGSTRTIVHPDTFTIDSAGNIDISVTNNTGSSATYSLVLTVPTSLSQQVLGSIASNATSNLLIENLDSPWVFPAIYTESSGIRELVRADFNSYNSDTKTLTLTFTNNSSSAKNVQAYYIYGITRSNQLCVTDTSVTVNASDTRPQLTIWGLNHSSIYGASAASTAGWANHIDSYRSTGEQKLVTGLGGNLFVATPTPSLLLYPNLRNRTNGAQVLAPLFWDTGATPGRTRGFITGDNLGSNWAVVTSALFDSDNGWVKYTLSIPGISVLDSNGSPTSISNVISVNSSYSDYLSIEQMSSTRLIGTFPIMQVDDTTPNILYIWVNNSQIYNSDYDDLNCGGAAAVMTDQLQLESPSSFLPGDVITNASIGSDFLCTVTGSNGNIVVVDGVVAILQIATGVVTVGTRNSFCVPSRTAQPSSSSSVSNFVAGDILSYTGIERKLRIVASHSDSDRTVNITGDGTTATATLQSGSTLGMAIGGYLILVRAGEYSGQIQVTAINSETEFEFSSGGTTSTTGTLLGDTLELDESLEWSDSVDDAVQLSVGERWYPIEAPTDSFDQTPSTYIKHFESNAYDSQPNIRSAMISNNLYLTNGQDEVMKYDGTNIYRAGIPAWQPGLFLTQDTSSTGKIVINPVTTKGNSDSSNTSTIHVGAGLHTQFPIGYYIRANGVDYQVLGHDSSSSEGYILVDKKVTTDLHTLDITLLSSFRYYFRLNAIDANNNTIATAVTGSQDHVIQLGADAGVNIKLVGLPNWDVYDYDRLEVEIHRTLSNTNAPFYKITTIPMQFNNGSGYINYTDSFSDTNLIERDATAAVQGNNLGVGWNEPLRAKYVCGIGNTLVLGNVRDVPKLDIQLSVPRTFSNSDLASKLLTFRRTGTGTVTDMLNTAAYEFRNTSSAISVTAATGTLNTSFTVSVTNSCTPGDWAYLFWGTVSTSGRPLTYAGWWQISSCTGSTITIKSTEVVSGTITSLVPDKCLFATDPTNIPIPLGTDGNMGMFNGDSFDIFDSMRRASMAINASMRMVDTTITGYSEFTPWLMARGGNDVGKAGRLLITQPKTDTGTLSILLPTLATGYSIFVNNALSTGTVNSSTRVFPSRVIISYESYPELFDNPAAQDARDSISAIDVNSADGQAITGIIPFFGESAFTAAQQAGILVVFKENSIYLVDLNVKRAGGNPVQRIESEGLGCTAPYSIAVTKGGVIFANESGIYCLRQNQTISYIGRFMERNWVDGVNRSRLDLAQGHHYGIGRAYKLSIPAASESTNSLVYVYNHTNEESGRIGAWSRYDNHPSTGWANLGSDAFFSSTSGRVFSIRNTGLAQDYRDDNQPIHFSLVTRALDFGSSVLRKILDKVYISYRSIATATGTTVSFAKDMSSNFIQGTQAIIQQSDSTNGIDDQYFKSVVQIGQTNPNRRGTYFQLKVENDSVDQNIEVAGISLNVKGLTERGKLQAGQSSDNYANSRNRAK